LLIKKKKNSFKQTQNQAEQKRGKTDNIAFKPKSSVKKIKMKGQKFQHSKSSKKSNSFKLHQHNTQHHTPKFKTQKNLHKLNQN
jgi:hypothetical protein